MTISTLPLTLALAQDPWVAAALRVLPAERLTPSPSSEAELLLILGAAARRIARVQSWWPVIRHRSLSDIPTQLRREREHGSPAWHHRWLGEEVADALEAAAAVGSLEGYDQSWDVRSPSVELARLALGGSSDEAILQLAILMEATPPSRRWSAVLTMVHQMRPRRVSALVASRQALTHALRVLPECSSVFVKAA